MAAEKRRVREAIFHIEYPERRDFLTWTELGCLCRALGFPNDTVRKQVNDEIHTEENGISVQQLHKMIEHKLLHQSLHRSFNMHTADWNLCVIIKALKLLQHFVLNFEELHSIRIAYATYEASDMKGLKLDKRTLLRTLKMCHRTISPLKLMHRVKHMRNTLEEPCRIQLYEFFDLVMWCDYVESLEKAELINNADGKENDLYYLVDFETLLSHQDQRKAHALDERYLAEEWDFGRERLGSKVIFKEQVVHTEGRIKQLHENQLSDKHYEFSRGETQYQKKRYRHLKSEISQSQRRVYRAHAGSIRARPISAPDLSMYATPRDHERSGAASAGDVYKSMQRRLHSAPSRASKADTTDRPPIQGYVRVQTPRVVTPDELDEVQLKIETLQFDIFTLDSRCQIKLEEEREFYIPGYQPPSYDTCDLPKEPSKPKEEHWTPEIIQNLAYPHQHISPHHAETCDARFRGWNKTQKRGRHRILTAPTFASSPQAHLLAKQRFSTLAPVAYMRPDYVVRYTPKSDAKKEASPRAVRPATAPAASPRAKQVKRVGTRSAGNARTPHDSYHFAHDTRLSKRKGIAVPRTEEIRDYYEQTTTTKDSGDLSKESPKHHRELAGSSFPRSLNSFRSDQACAEATSPGCHPGQDSAASGSLPAYNSMASKTQAASGEGTSAVDHALNSVAPPYQTKRQNRAKTVEVGLMGTISLLESIQEHQDLEDHVSDSESSSAKNGELITSGGHPAKEPPYASNQNSRMTNNHRDDVNDLRNHIRDYQDHVRHRSGKVDGRLKEEEERKAVGTPLTKEALEMLAQQLKEENNGHCRVFITKKPPPYNSRQAAEKSGESMGVNRGGTNRQIRRELSWEDQNGGPRKADITSGKGQNVAQEAMNKLSLSADNGLDLTPLTSITVTVKDKTHHVTNSDLPVSDDADQLRHRSLKGDGRLEDEEEETDGRFYSPPFSGSPPYSTSTPKRVQSPVILSNRTKIKKENENMQKQNGNTGIDIFDNNPFSPILPSTGGQNGSKWVNENVSEQQTTPSTSEGVTERGRRLSDKNNNVEDSGNTQASENDVKPGDIERKRSIQFAPETADTEKSSSRRKLQTQTSTELLLRPRDFNLDAETPRKFSFNKVTTRRLLSRVQDQISPELMVRITEGDMGLKVVC